MEKIHIFVALSMHKARGCPSKYELARTIVHASDKARPTCRPLEDCDKLSHEELSHPSLSSSPEEGDVDEEKDESLSNRPVST
jgi:hypothetical protein